MDLNFREKLSPAQFCVMREHATEPAGTSALNSENRDGVYHCAACDQTLFSSTTKYESGSGWPSFFAPIEGHVAYDTDTKIGYVRTEVHCARCQSHLGHVFDDGPAPTGKRYCMNGIALTFAPNDPTGEKLEDVA